MLLNRAKCAIRCGVSARVWDAENQRCATAKKFSSLRVATQHLTPRKIEIHISGTFPFHIGDYSTFKMCCSSTFGIVFRKSPRLHFVAFWSVVARPNTPKHTHWCIRVSFWRMYAVHQANTRAITKRKFAHFCVFWKLRIFRRLRVQTAPQELFLC